MAALLRRYSCLSVLISTPAARRWRSSMTWAGVCGVCLWPSLLYYYLRLPEHLLGLDRDGQPGMVPGHRAGGSPPPNVLLPSPERPHLHDRHRGVKARGLVIPSVEPDLVARAKRRPHRMAGVRWRARGPVLLRRARLLGTQGRSSRI